MIDSVICKLQKPVKYGTDNKETEFVEVRCPSYSTVGQRKYRRSLKAMLAAIIIEEGKEASEVDEAQKEEAEAKLKEGELPFTPAQVLLTVSAALGEEDFPNAVEQFCAHAKDIVFLGGEDSAKSGTLDRMHPDDVDMIFATFIANFIMPSLLMSLNGNE